MTRKKEVVIDLSKLKPGMKGSAHLAVRQAHTAPPARPGPVHVSAAPVVTHFLAAGGRQRRKILYVQRRDDSTDFCSEVIVVQKIAKRLGSCRETTWHAHAGLGPLAD